MADWHTPNIEPLRRQQESLRAVIEAIGHKGEFYPSLTDLSQHARELLDAMEVEQTALSSEIVRLGEAAGRRATRSATINRIGRLIPAILASTRSSRPPSKRSAKTSISPTWA